MLRKPELKTRRQKRRERSEFAVAGNTVIVEPDRQVGAPLETLVIGKVRRTGILRHHRSAAEQAGCQYVGVIVLQRRGDNRIEAGDGRSDSKCRTD